MGETCRNSRNRLSLYNSRTISQLCFWNAIDGSFNQLTSYSARSGGKLANSDWRLTWIIRVMSGSYNFPGLTSENLFNRFDFSRSSTRRRNSSLGYHNYTVMSGSNQTEESTRSYLFLERNLLILLLNKVHFNTNRISYIDLIRLSSRNDECFECPAHRWQSCFRRAVPLLSPSLVYDGISSRNSSSL